MKMLGLHIYVIYQRWNISFEAYKQLLRTIYLNEKYAAWYSTTMKWKREKNTKQKKYKYESLGWNNLTVER